MYFGHECQNGFLATCRADKNRSCSEVRSCAGGMAAVVYAILKRKRQWILTYRTQAERAAILSGNGGSEDDGLIRQGKLEKRGGRVGDAWNARWVKLAPDLLSYYYYDEPTHRPGAMIDRIPIYEVEVRLLDAYARRWDAYPCARCLNIRSTYN